MEFDTNNKIVQFCEEGMNMEEKGDPDEAKKLFLTAWEELMTDTEKFTNIN